MTVIKSYDGKVYLRQNDRTIELNFEQILMLKYDGCQRYFEDEIAEGSSIEDIDESLIDIYREKVEYKKYDHRGDIKSKKISG